MSFGNNIEYVYSYIHLHGYIASPYYLAGYHNSKQKTQFGVFLRNEMFFSCACLRSKAAAAQARDQASGIQHSVKFEAFCILQL